MDNVQDLNSAAPSQGQPQPSQAPTPNSDASGNNPTSGHVEATNPSEGSQANQFVMPDKFSGKTAEEIAQEYVKLESYNKKVEMDKAELTKLFVEQPAPLETPSAAAPESSDDDPLAALRPVFRDEVGKLLSPVLAKMEVEDAVRKFGDSFVKAAPQVAELRKQNPSLTLDAAYKIVAYDNLERTAMNEGLAKAQKTQELAQKAQVETASPSGQRAPTLEDALNDKNVPFDQLLEAMGPEYQKAYAKNLKK